MSTIQVETRQVQKKQAQTDFHYASKLITCVLPDDGRDMELLTLLRSEKGIVSASTFQCRGIGPRPQGEKEHSKLDASSVRVVTVVVPKEKADDLFEYIYFKMGFDHPIAGIMYQGDLLTATPFLLPEGVADELHEHHVF